MANDQLSEAWVIAQIPDRLKQHIDSTKDCWIVHKHYFIGTFLNYSAELTVNYSETTSLHDVKK